MSTILRSFFSVLLFLLPMVVHAQDTVKFDIARTHGIRLGVDVSRLALPLLYDDNRSGIEFTIDKQISPLVFLTAEAGYLSMDSKKNGYHYEMNGSYVRFGGDMQILKYRIKESRDHVYAGIRYGLSVFQHQASDMVVPDGYWPSAQLEDVPSETLHSQWIEGVIGAKVEIVKRLYIGAALRAKVRVLKAESDQMPAINVPGYGAGDKKKVVSLSYTLSYMFGPY